MKPAKTKTPIDTREPVFTTEQASPLLHLSVWTVKEKCAAGLIRATKPGRHWLIPESAISDYLTRRSN